MWFPLIEIEYLVYRCSGIIYYANFIINRRRNGQMEGWGSDATWREEAEVACLEHATTLQAAHKPPATICEQLPQKVTSGRLDTCVQDNAGEFHTIIIYA